MLDGRVKSGGKNDARRTSGRCRVTTDDTNSVERCLRHWTKCGRGSAYTRGEARTHTLRRSREPAVCTRRLMRQIA